MKNIYIFSGLGTDERVFKNLSFNECNVTFIKWQEPRTEPINIYATRLLHQIKSPKPIFIGLSFGGMVAIEVAKHIEAEKVILIASAKTKNEIPYYYRLAGTFRLHKLLPTGLLRKSNAISNWFFGTEAINEKQLLAEILRDTSPVFLKWALDQIVQWKNVVYGNNVIHIHGTADRILPIRFIKYDIKIRNGGHFMTVNKADQLNEILNELIQ
jgi:pimeloyl-ACP methyl ester carboxylesterase